VSTAFGLATLLAKFLLKQFSEGLVRAVGGWSVTGSAADQIGHLVIKPLCPDGFRAMGVTRNGFHIRMVSR